MSGPTLSDSEERRWRAMPGITPRAAFYRKKETSAF